MRTQRSEPSLRPAEPEKTQVAETPIFSAGEPEPPRRRRWPWIAGAVVLLVVAVLVLRGRGDKAAAAKKGKPAPRPVPVVAEPARAGEMPVYINGLGTVTPLATVAVRSRIDGELVRVSFREGQMVRKGDLLAEIDPRPYEVQLMQAQGQLSKDEAALKNVRLDLARLESLAAQGIAPRQQLDTQRAAVNQAEGTIKSDQAQVASARLNISYTKVTAPITGRVGLRQVDVGNFTRANDPNGIVVLTQLQPIAVLFTIPADQLPPVMKEMAAGRQLPVEAYDREMKLRLAGGTLSAVDNQIDQTTGTVRMKATFDNADTALFPNQFVNARLLVSTLQHVVLVPSAALQRGNQGTFVYVVKAAPDGAAEIASAESPATRAADRLVVEMRNVTVVRTEGDVTAVSSGVAAGEQVVTDGLDKLQNGSLVSVAKPGEAARPAGGGKGGGKGAMKGDKGRG